MAVITLHLAQSFRFSTDELKEAFEVLADIEKADYANLLTGDSTPSDALVTWEESPRLEWNTYAFD